MNTTTSNNYTLKTPTVELSKAPIVYNWLSILPDFVWRYGICFRNASLLRTGCSPWLFKKTFATSDQRLMSRLWMTQPQTENKVRGIPRGNRFPVLTVSLLFGLHLGRIFFQRNRNLNTTIQTMILSLKKHIIFCLLISSWYILRRH